MTYQWENVKPLIAKYYFTENRTLKQVQKIMEEEHGFKSSYASPLL